MGWTDEQLKCIQLRDKNILVSAAAGSGKTAVLVERIVSLIEDEKVDIDRFLIVTFTNAAAGEMKERIQKKLLENLKKKSHLGDFYRRQLTLLPRANIKTLHSFCIDVIRNNFHKIEIDPDFRIGDSTEIDFIKTQVLEEVLEAEYLKEEEDFVNLVESFTGNRNDSKLIEIIETVYGFILSKPDPIGWLRELSIEQGKSKNISDTKWGAFLKEEIVEIIKSGENSLLQAIEIANKDMGPLEYVEALESDLDYIRKLMECSELEDILHNVSEVSFKTLKRISKSRKEEVDPELLEKVKALRDYYKKKVIGEIKGFLAFFKGESFIKSLEFSKNNLDVIIRIVESFHEEFLQAKIENNLLDFNDIEHMSIDILKDTDISDYYRRKFKYIFVDEYQDNNIIQETIVGMIKRENNLFLVGDVKQSIYGFRLAEPELFLEKYRDYKGDEISEKIDLNKNFRSSDGVLSFINMIFKKIMNLDTNNIDYDKDSMLYPGLEFDKEEGFTAKMDLIERPDQSDLGEELYGLTWVEIEARKAALNIKEIVGQKIYDGKTKSFREISHRDIVILSRTGSNLTDIYNNVFAEENIPMYVDDSRGYFDEFEVKILIDFLSLINNNTQDLKLLSVMRSMIGGFNVSELVEIRTSGDYTSFYQAVYKYKELFDNPISDKIKKFFKLLKESRRLSNIKGLGDFIWDLVLETEFYYYIGSMVKGKVRQGNIRLFIDRAVSYEKNWISGLSGFLNYIDKAKTSSNDYSPASMISAKDDVVRFMTIHKSKGLEFPVVILSGMGKGFNFQDVRSKMVFHKELGIGMKYIDHENRYMTESLIRKAISLKKKREVIEEEMRIFYVALTRAVNKLILLGSVKDIEKSVDGWTGKDNSFFYRKASSYLDFVMPGLVSNLDLELRNGPEFDKIYEGEGFELQFANIDFIKKGEIQSTVEYQDKVNKLMEMVSSDEEYKKFDQVFGRSYSHEENTMIPSKLTVTMLKNIKEGKISLDQEIKLKEEFKKPKFIEEIDSYSSMDIGTLTHSLMLLIDFSKIDSMEDLHTQIQAIVSRKLIKPEEIELVDLNSIYKFSKSTICDRMINSDELYREVPFVLKMDELRGDSLLLQGIIDCYFVEDGQAVLIDYKTDKVEASPEEVARRYKKQIENYSTAIEKIRDIRVKERYIYLMSVDKFIKL
ncbi:MAG: helicase-exonuclease AddAB subunit AddA [Firmicutes bacterium]|nr:helicase-exonuclease AddAB subunit AddA [Bacillota bacterium]